MRHVLCRVISKNILGITPVLTTCKTKIWIMTFVSAVTSASHMIILILLQFGILKFKARQRYKNSDNISMI